MQINTNKSGKKKQLFQAFWKVIFIYLFLVCNILSGQIVIKGDTQLYVKSDSVFHSDTIIYQRSDPSNTEKRIAKLYVVKGTLTSNWVENQEIEIIYTETPKSKQKKKESTLTRSNQTDRFIVQTQQKPEIEKNTFFLSRALKGNTNLITGKEIISAAVNFTPSVKKEVSIVKNNVTLITAGLENNSANHYFNEKICGCVYTTSFKVRPPPLYLNI